MADHALEEAIEHFMGITGAKPEAARHMLEICGCDLENAVTLWYTDEELQRSLSNPAPTSSTNATAAGPSTSGSRPSGARAGPRPIGREVINLDSDDDDVQMTENESFDGFDDDDDTAVAATVARTAQEEEDAAMAKRLQEELYSSGAANDEVRAPMARTTETLVSPSLNPYGDAEHRNFEEPMETLRRLNAQLPQRRAARSNPFAQPSIWDDSGNRPAGPSSSTGTRAQRLAELFRPPYDLISPLSWDEARDEGKSAKKWIMVNLQDMSDFNCQALNRDIWKDEAVKEMVAENFIFLQFDKNDDAALQYVQFYFPNQTHENPNNYPHVSIIDPRTGEQVKVWSGIPFPNAGDFLGQLVEFLDRYSLAANRKNPVTKAKRPERAVNVDRMTEDEMFELALKNSLAANGSGDQPNVSDPDELTRSTHDLSSAKGKEAAQPPAAAASEPSAPASAFSRIPSDRPHVEPQADPKTTTRIQVRHPAGRVIRRFRLDEAVSRMYEWLKAEPLSGKEGVEFELKSMPQGTDLIDLLDNTISEAGLANGTVMIEFIEPE